MHTHSPGLSRKFSTADYGIRFQRFAAWNLDESRVCPEFQPDRCT